MSDIPPLTGPEAQGQARLCIAATTDLHMRLTGGDGPPDADAPHGLVRLARRIEALRAERPGLVLLDNGDAFQGTALGRLAASDKGPDPHPMIAVMNRLGYDAMALGNHDFDFGLAALARMARQADFPMLTANLSLSRDGEDWPFQRATLVRREVTLDTGVVLPLTIGIGGLQPPETPAWNAEVLGDRVRALPMIDTARQVVADLRAAGADIVVLLAHTGIGLDEPVSRNHGRALSQLDGVDLLILGHTHSVFPNRMPCPPGLGRTAILQPGSHARYLGLADMVLERRGHRWQVQRIVTEAEPASEAASDIPEIAALIAPWQARARAHVSRIVGQSDAHLHGHFAGLPDDPATLWVAKEQRRHIARLLRDRPEADLPLVSATAPMSGGMRSDGALPGAARPAADIPPGPLCNGDLVALYPHENRVLALKVTGAMLREWVRVAAMALGRAAPGERRPLLDPSVPVYTLDHLHGLDYRIDLSRAPSDPARVGTLSIADRTVADDDTVIVAVNSYRASAVGLFGFLAQARRLDLPAHAVRDVLRRSLSEHPARLVPPSWGFAPCPGAVMTLDLPEAGLLPPLPGRATVQAEPDTVHRRLALSL